MANLLLGQWWHCERTWNTSGNRWESAQPLDSISIFHKYMPSYHSDTWLAHAIYLLGVLRCTITCLRFSFSLSPIRMLCFIIQSSFPQIIIDWINHIYLPYFIQYVWLDTFDHIYLANNIDNMIHSNEVDHIFQNNTSNQRHPYALWDNHHLYYTSYNMLIIFVRVIQMI